MIELPPIGNVLVLAVERGPREFVSRIAQEARERILLARIAELEADAERYLYLLDNCYAHAPPAPKEKVYLVSTVNAADWRTATGAAIDAARGAK